jgi:prepilin-type N-terminal cleavage/methylation domain-containing protein
VSAAADEHGFTLVELLVTMALALVVFGATLSLFDVFQSNNRRDLLRHETQDNARNTMDRLARQLRNAVAPTGEQVYGALEQAGRWELTFQTIEASQSAKGKNALGAMRVHYCLNDSVATNEVLWMQIKRWETENAPTLPTATSCPDAVSGDYESSTQVVQHLTNRLGGQGESPSEKRELFAYGPAGATEVSKIIAVQTNIYLDLNPGSKPGETQLTSTVSLRNEARQPTASFTATVVGNTVLLNASESRDPDGLTLTYKWWLNSAELSSAAQQYTTEALSKGEKLFKLEVTSSGGLKNTSEKKVLIS